jgi:hypothetical protein
MRRLAWCLTVVAIILAAAPARAQLFVASRPDPPFTIGPLMVRATVTEGPGPVPVVVGFSLQLAPNRTPADVAQDVFLLWPGEVVNAAPDRKADATLARYVTDQGFEITGEGHVKLVARNLGDAGTVEALPVGAPFVTFVQTGPLGLSGPATFVRIPWSPRLADRSWLMEPTLDAAGLTAGEGGLGGAPRPRHPLPGGGRVPRGAGSSALSDVLRAPRPGGAAGRRTGRAGGAVPPVRPAQDRRRVPPTAIRRLSETLETTEVVSLFLDRSTGSPRSSSPCSSATRAPRPRCWWPPVAHLRAGASDGDPSSAVGSLG